MPRSTRLLATLTCTALAATVVAPLGSAAPAGTPTAPGGAARAAAAGDASVSATPVVLSREGDRAAVAVRLGVEGGGRLDGALTVRWRTRAGTAEADRDFRGAAGAVTFPAGAPDGATRRVHVPLLRDGAAEVAESLHVVLGTPAGVAAGGSARVVVAAHGLPYLDRSLPARDRVRDLVGRMTLGEMVGQMLQGERGRVDGERDLIRTARVGSLLSGGGSTPTPNTPTAWADMVDAYQTYALATRLQIPLVYGVDSVHGHGNLPGGTLFPHNIGLGATRDPAIVRRTSHVTAIETRATGVPWTFAPCLCVARDTRWGRTYESYGEDAALVERLETSIEGLQGTRRSDLRRPDRVLATIKHFAGDGATQYGTGRGDFAIDQGIAVTSFPAFERVALAPYVPAVRTYDAGSVMPSFSSVDWTEDGVGNPIAMHAHRELIQGWLKDRVGFDGFVISDYNGIHQIEPDIGALSYTEVVQAVNAGIDMAMEPWDFLQFRDYLLTAVREGEVSRARIRDAATRILLKKVELGRFERPVSTRGAIGDIGSAAHRRVARAAVAQSQVLLKNDGAVLPLARDARVYVAGRNADDLGNQAGGWTIGWQGLSGRPTEGTTILEGIRQVAPRASVTYSVDASAPTAGSDVGVVVVGETPYSEGFGDVGGPQWLDDGVPREVKSLELQPGDKAVVEKVCAELPECVVLVVSGRPQQVTDQLPSIDALVASWLPGTEGAGVADVLFGRRAFTGQLPQTWPRTAAQEPINVGDASYAPLYPFGWGLSTRRTTEASSATALGLARAAVRSAAPPSERLVQRLRLLVQDAVADPDTGVATRPADRIARADRALLRGERRLAVELLVQALG